MLLLAITFTALQTWERSAAKVSKRARSRLSVCSIEWQLRPAAVHPIIAWSKIYLSDGELRATTSQFEQSLDKKGAVYNWTGYTAQCYHKASSKFGDFKMNEKAKPEILDDDDLDTASGGIFDPNHKETSSGLSKFLSNDSAPRRSIPRDLLIDSVDTSRSFMSFDTISPTSSQGAEGVMIEVMTVKPEKMEM